MANAVGANAVGSIANAVGSIANAVGANAVGTNDNDEILDTQWLDEFNHAERSYNEFYKEPVAAINIYFLYVSKENELEHIHSDKCLLQEKGTIKREIIISFIKRYQLLFSIHYKLLALLKYNIDLEPLEIKDFIAEATTQTNDRFMHSEKYLEDIQFKDSIHMFQDLNALFFIFYEDKPSVHNTRRVKLSAATPYHKTRRNNPNIKNLKINKHLS
jgi:hypothetical protein